MDITLDISNNFNYVVNYNIFFDCKVPLNPVLFFEDLLCLNRTLNFELMNFGLNIDDSIAKEIATNYPTLKNVLDCDFIYKSFIIWGRARFNITKIKGICIQLLEPGKPPYKKIYKEDKTIQIIQSDGLYYEQFCTIKKGDRFFQCGGNSAHSNHFVYLNLITDNDAMANITFPSDEYILKESDDEEYETTLAKKQTPYDYLDYVKNINILDKFTSKKSKMLEVEYRNKYFGGYYIAIDDEI